MNKNTDRYSNYSRVLTICLIATATISGVLFFDTFSQAQEDTLGKSSQQILAMGDKKWLDYYASKHNYTDRSIADAQLVFARVLGQSNDKKIASLPLAKRTRIQDIRRSAREYATSLMDVESYSSGASYIPIRTGIGSDVEQVIRGLLFTPTTSAKDAKSNARKCGNAAVSSITRLEYFVRQIPANSQSTPSDAGKLIADVEQAKAAYNKIRTMLATAPDTDTSTVASFLALRAHDALVSAQYQAGLAAKSQNETVATLCLGCKLSWEMADSWYDNHDTVRSLSIALLGNYPTISALTKERYSHGPDGGIFQTYTYLAGVQTTLALLLPRNVLIKTLETKLSKIPLVLEWRDELFEMIRSQGGSNQGGTATRGDRNARRYANMNFGSQSEIRIAEALDRRRVLYFPNCMGRVNHGRDRVNREPDFLICDGGKWGILEVHGGPFHPATTAVHDHERGRLFGAHGVRVIENYDAQICYMEPDQVVSNFLDLLAKNG